MAKKYTLCKCGTRNDRYEAKCAAGEPDAERWRRRPGAIGPLPAPGMTDLMVTPEAIDKFLAENPPDALT